MDEYELKHSAVRYVRVGGCSKKHIINVYLVSVKITLSNFHLMRLAPDVLRSTGGRGKYFAVGVLFSLSFRR